MAPLTLVSKTKPKASLLPSFARAEREARLLRIQTDLLLLIHDPLMTDEVDNLRLAYSILSNAKVGA